MKERPLPRIFTERCAFHKGIEVGNMLNRRSGSAGLAEITLLNSTTNHGISFPKYEVQFARYGDGDLAHHA